MSLGRVFFALVLGFAAWTLAQNLSFFIGFSPRDCCWFALLFGTLLGLIAWSLGRYESSRGMPLWNGNWCKGLGNRWTAVNVMVLVAFVILGVAINAKLFAVALLFISIASFLSRLGDDTTVCGSSANADRVACLGAFAAGLYVLVLRTADGDDTHYLAASANVARSFYSPLASHYPIFPYVDVPPPYPTFSLIAYHDLIGALSYFSGWQPVEIASYLVAPLFAALVVFAYYLCFKRLSGEAAGYCTFFALFYLVLVGGSARSFGDFAFPRIWQGKSVLLHICIPLLLCCLQDFAEHRRPRQLFWVTLLVVCSSGFSSVALWLIPPIVVAFLLPDLLSDLRSGKTGLAKSMGVMLCHPVLLIAWAYSGSVASMAHRTEKASYEKALESVFNNLHQASGSIFLIGLGLLLVRDYRLRVRLASVVGVYCLTIGNPLLSEQVASKVTSLPVYWRIWWVLPCGILIGLAMGNAVTRFQGVRRQLLAVLISGGLLLGLHSSAIWASGKITSAPRLKMDAEVFEALIALQGQIPETAYIVAPPDCSRIIPTLSFDWHALKPSDPFSFRTLAQRLNRHNDHRRRKKLTKYLGGQDEFDEEIWQTVLTRHPVNVVIGRKRISDAQQLDSFLREKGFEPVFGANWRVWVHPGHVPEPPFRHRDLWSRGLSPEREM